VLAKGAEILQKGTPGEIISKPANDFIASFVGADKANRQLKLSEEFGQKLIRDADGKVLGTLDQ
jgi:ABC-type proline/glycine betaine transport systems, ATPase components